MRIRHAFVVSTLLLVAVPAGSTPASAGGSWLVPERSAYVPAEIAVYHGSFGTGSLEGTIADGPYIAYLLPRARWIEGHDVPASAIRLGEIEIRSSSSHHLFRARLRFEVPDVPTGIYHVQYCNEPCTVNGIGDLVGGDTIAIGATLTEARLLIRSERLRWEVETAAERARQRVRTVQREFQDLMAERADDLDAVEARVRVLASELAETRRALQVERSRGPWAPVAAALAVVAVALVAAVIRLATMLRHARLDAELASLTHDDGIRVDR